MKRKRAVLVLMVLAALAAAAEANCKDNRIIVPCGSDFLCSSEFNQTHLPTARGQCQGPGFMTREKAEAHPDCFIPHPCDIQWTWTDDDFPEYEKIVVIKKEGRVVLLHQQYCWFSLDLTPQRYTLISTTPSHIVHLDICREEVNQYLVSHVEITSDTTSVTYVVFIILAVVGAYCSIVYRPRYRNRRIFRKITSIRTAWT